MAEDVNTTVVQGSKSADIGMTIAEGQKAQPSNEPTAESLGVTAQQFEKYYKDGNYNWEAHAKEQQYILEQRSKQPEQAQDQSASTSETEAQGLVEQAGLNWDDLGQKIASKGDLDVADYQALQKIGVPEHIVKDYVNSVHRNAEAHVSNVMGAFGGEQNFERIKSWAQENYNEAQLQQLESALADPSGYQLAVDLLLARSGMAGPVAPNAAYGGTTQVEGYSSQAEMVMAMRDPRYRNDVGYRREVEAKVAASTWGANPRQHSI